MELIPILSFIILVATISTFILAIGAYVLYKTRERKGRLQGVSAAPQIVEAELYTPEARLEAGPGMYGAAGPYQERGYVPERQQYTGERISPRMTTSEQPYPYQQQAPARGYNAQNYYTQAREYNQNPPMQRGVPGQFIPQEEEEGNERNDSRKFMKYTSEGYVPVNEKKNGENLKWR